MEPVSSKNVVLDQDKAYSSCKMRNDISQAPSSAKSDRFDSSTELTVDETSMDSSEFWCHVDEDDYQDNKRTKGCLRIKTHNESLFRPYGASNNQRKNKSVGWSCVDVYTHFFILGDHPCTQAGPPLTISWEANDHQQLSIDDYEKIFKRKRFFRKSGILSPTWREHILIHDGYSRSELQQVISEAQLIRSNREKSRQDPNLLVRMSRYSTSTIEKSSSMLLKDLFRKWAGKKQRCVHSQSKYAKMLPNASQ